MIFGDSNVINNPHDIAGSNVNIVNKNVGGDNIYGEIIGSSSI